MTHDRLRAPTTDQIAVLPQKPTPPPKVFPVVMAAAVGWLVACALLARAFILINRHINADGSFIPAAILVVLFALAFLPLIPLIRGARGLPARRAAIARDDLAAARHVSAVSQEHALVTLGFSSGVLIIGLLLSLIMANDAAIAKTFLNFEFIADSMLDVTKAFWINIKVAFGAEVIVLVAGLLIAVMRLLPGRAGRPLRWIATLYVDVFRAIPSIIVIYLVGFGLSTAKVPFFKDLSPISLAILALALTYTGYVAEVYRAGLESIHPSQWAAARSLGLSYGETLRKVIIPQAFRRIIPPLLNDFIGLQKDTALISIMGVVDAFMQSRMYASAHFNLSPVTVVAIVFVIATIPQARFVDSLIAKDKRRQQTGQ